MMVKHSLTFGIVLLSHSLIEVLAGSPLIIGVDLGTESARVGIFNTKGEPISSSSAVYATHFNQAGWAEQDPSDWWTCLGKACRDAVSDVACPEDVVGIAVDTTACSVVALDENHSPLRRCLLWMDSRSAGQTQEILTKGVGDDALKVNCNGAGPLSAEWMLPKALWIKQSEPHIWRKAKFICEKQDFINFKLTGRYCASGCNVAARWHWDAEQACSPPTSAPSATIGDQLLVHGRPVELLRKIGLSDILEKWPQECVPMGEVVGPLSAEAAVHLGLRPGIPVTQGGPDAYVGMVGLGCVRPGKMAMITGSSHLHLVITDKDKEVHADGVWGTYSGAPMRGLRFAEGGQSSTGSIVAWARRMFDSQRLKEEQSTQAPSEGRTPLSYDELNEEAAELPIGAEGLLAVETFQGSRTPVTDAKAKGALLGLTLAHTRAHIWRALMEGVCLGTRAAVEALQRAGLGTDEIAMAGGATRSSLWLQMHADATGLPIVVGEFDNAPLLGSAMLAAVGAGLFDCGDHANVSKEGHGQGEDDDEGESESPVGDSRAQAVLQKVGRAVGAMVRPARRIEPDAHAHAQYSRLFAVYQKAVNDVRAVSHALTSSASTSDDVTDDRKEDVGTKIKCDSHEFDEKLEQVDKDAGGASVAAWTHTLPSGRCAEVVPSILAADFAALGAEAQVCLGAGAQWLHVDVCDGGRACGGSLTLGPQAVAAIHAQCPGLLLDVHVASSDVLSLVWPLARAGTTRLVFQFEAIGGAKWRRGHKAMKIARAIREAGMLCGIAIAPGTPVKNIRSLLLSRCGECGKPGIAAHPSPPDDGSWLIDLVDVLAVNPGYGGQSFDRSVLDKVKTLVQEYPHVANVAVDGGVNAETAGEAAREGANVFIAGSTVFGPSRQHSDGPACIQSALDVLRTAVSSIR